jgi:hypothetical protein
MRVKSIEDEISKRGWACVKSIAARKKLVPELFCEADLVEDNSSATVDNVQLDLDFLKGCKAARCYANGVLESRQDASADACATILETKVSQLLAMDPAFAVEIAFFASMTGENADKRVCNMILDCLPSDERLFMTPQQAQELVASLRNKKVLSFCTAAGKAAFSTAVEMVAALCMDKRPQLPQAGCAGKFVQDLNKSLAYFIRQEVERIQIDPQSPRPTEDYNHRHGE